jgi:hypothetical protein
MMLSLKRLVYQSWLYDLLRPAKQRFDWLIWALRGRAIPLPALYKQSIVSEYGRKYGLDTLIETGTYLGDMIYANRRAFQKIISIELDQDLFDLAQRRYARFKHIELIRGNSSEVLPALLSHIDHSCLFWLDAHYSQGITSRAALDTPIIQELDCILNQSLPGQVILIDDARCFVGRDSYPTLDELDRFVRAKWLAPAIEVKHDIIRIIL